MGTLRPRLSGEMPKQSQVSPKTAPTRAALPQSGASTACGRGVVDLETSTIDVDSSESPHASSGRSQRFPNCFDGLPKPQGAPQPKGRSGLRRAHGRPGSPRIRPRAGSRHRCEWRLACRRRLEGERGHSMSAALGGSQQAAE